MGAVNSPLTIVFFIKVDFALVGMIDIGCGVPECSIAVDAFGYVDVTGYDGVLPWIIVALIGVIAIIVYYLMRNYSQDETNTIGMYYCDRSLFVVFFLLRDFYGLVEVPVTNRSVDFASFSH